MTARIASTPITTSCRHSFQYRLFLSGTTDGESPITSDSPPRVDKDFLLRTSIFVGVVLNTVLGIANCQNLLFVINSGRELIVNYKLILTLICVGLALQFLLSFSLLYFACFFVRKPSSDKAFIHLTYVTLILVSAAAMLNVMIVVFDSKDEVLKTCRKICQKD